MSRSRPTMTDIALECGVSKNTVSLALRNNAQIPEQTRLRIRAVAGKLGYRKNPTVAHLMAQLRLGKKKGGAQAALALINAHQDKEAFKHHPTLPVYVEGCRRRAAELGYGLDEFWLHDPDLDSDRLAHILQSRGIRGAVIVGLMKENRLRPHFDAFWKRFPCVVTGVRTHEPALSFAAVDHHMIALQAFRKALDLGYQRPALVLDPVIDRLVDGRFSSGILIAQKVLPADRRTKAFYGVEEAQGNLSHFSRWLKKEKPDLILTLYNVVRRWLEDLGYRIPQDMGLIQLEWRRDRPEWAGMNQHNDITGEAAVEMVIGMIHHGMEALSPFPRATLISGTWVDGKTVLSVNHDK